MPIIPVAEYMPDQPAIPGVGSSKILNVLPRTKASYGPFAGLSEFSTGTNPASRVQGSYACQDTSGNVSIFAGDDAALYRLTAGATTFSDVSVAAGYSTATDGRWEFVLFGQRVIATNGTDVLQGFLLGTDTKFSDLVSTGVTTLKAAHIGVVKDWLVCGNTNDGTDGAQPQRVWWSAIRDPGDFPILGSADAAAKQSDKQDLFGNAGIVQGIVGNLGTADGAIFQQRAVVRMAYAGPPVIFAFSVAEGVRGTPAPGSIVQIGALVYYLGEDGFYVFNGSTSLPIGAGKVDKTFFADLDQSFFHRISAAVDPINKVVFWGYPGAGHTDGNPNRILAYNWELGRWSITEANAVQIELLLRSLTPGYSADNLDTVVPDIDAATAILSFDSRIYTKGRSVLAGFNASHKLCTFSGSNLSPTVETAESELTPGRLTTVTRVRPIVDAGTPSVAIGRRNRSVDAVTYDAAVPMGDDGSCPVRSTGRYLKAKLTLPAGSSFTHISGLEISEAAAQGAR